MAEYIDAAYVATIATKYGLTWSPSGDAGTQAIARSRIVIDAMDWKGRKVAGRSQAEQFPRAGLVDRDGYLVDSSTIPPEIKEANALLAIVELANPGVMTPTVTLGELVKSVKAGSVSVEFRDGGGVTSAMPIITRVEYILAPLQGIRNPFVLNRG